MPDNNNYLDYPTATRLSKKDKDNYRYGHISIGDLLKRIEVLEKVSNNQQKTIESLNVQIQSYIKSNDDLKKKIKSYNQRIEALEKAGTVAKIDRITLPKKKIAVGDTITFGSYKETPIEWIVLDEKADGSKLLLSKYVLDNKKYNEEFTKVTWETCTLRKWLNNDFYREVFSSSEQSKIQTSSVINADNKKYNTKGGNNTKDKVFLLSIDEANKYFSSDKERECKATEYAKKQGIYVDGNGNSYYRLRSPGYYADYAALVYGLGDVDEGGSNVHSTDGIRPAMWVQI